VEPEKENAKCIFSRARVTIWRRQLNLLREIELSKELSDLPLPKPHVSVALFIRKGRNVAVFITLVNGIKSVPNKVPYLVHTD